ncbi:MAG: GGDEF domain-containing protein [Gammaproteobacteria bacterium]|nr:GGDEF domain-containing protein [Gammaproteobacteria bacterium]MBU2059695.1 GGDEF domain-containing protein [Gammaproteobacteria bacterium]MBU2176130.1 GGDEF domain-containing protein [Gammaproteobacteria bacterium]MBU2245318.1 GGDEF domain-containing protein [Gammaproteobacteria bacterium]MBU2345841.1 GGDEF domain-containing protein [Gammaproteobacteria bacterium]
MSEDWLTGPVLEQLNSGVLVVNEQLQLVYLNSFLQRHSSVQLSDVKGKSLFQVFTDVPEAWLRRKFASVLELQSPSFSSWEQRQYIIKLPHLRPVTSSSQYMAQNCTMLPLNDPEGRRYVCLLIEDATDAFVYQQHLQSTLQKLELSNRIDGLTQALNRRYWEEQLKLEVQRAQRYQQPLSLLLFDLDKFKQLNDQYGHLGGDCVLIELTARVRVLLRDTDWFGRYGGEEFGIVLTNTALAGALEVAERVCLAVNSTAVTFHDQSIATSVSIGVAQLDAVGDRAHEVLIGQADIALYNAKRDGRNRVVVFSAGETEFLLKAN